ncbi:unnamed protein product [Owenia fusiformis]|uniref:Uncharacterized protein n=1 Tax=Owenia fusiformis TaxID=6347 RepID=A0A8J1Y435_OWEFU|nr:unnamed protein product [Owenia fusiformis]
MNTTPPQGWAPSRPYKQDPTAELGRTNVCPGERDVSGPSSAPRPEAALPEARIMGLLAREQDPLLAGPLGIFSAAEEDALLEGPNVLLEDVNIDELLQYID